MKKKKLISYSKFYRVRHNKKSVSCLAYRSRARSYEIEHSLEAYKLGGYVYAVFKDKNQSMCRLSTHCMRYWVGDDERFDLFAYTVTADCRI